MAAPKATEKNVDRLKRSSLVEKAALGKNQGGN
jgi:hypothetical protein